MFYLLCALLSLVLLVAPRLPFGPGPRVAVQDPDSVLDAFDRPSAALMWPGATRAFLIEPDGCLYNGVWRVELNARANGRHAGPPGHIAYEDRWVPVAHWTEQCGDVRWEFEAVALPAPETPLTPVARELDAVAAERADRTAWEQRRRALTLHDRDRMDHVVVGAEHRVRLGAGEDVPLVVSVRATAHNRGRQPALAALDVSFSRARDTEPWYEGGARAPAPRLGWWTPGADSALGWRDASCTARPAAAARLAPGAECVLRFVVASHPLPASRLAAWARTPHAARANQARRWWSAEVSRGTRFQLDDPEVQTALDAARVVLLSCRERRGGRWMPLGGPFQYRDVRLGDGARAIAALATQGYIREARELATSLLEWQSSNGPFVSQGARLDGTGEALWAFEQAMLRPSPAPDVARFAASALDAWGWCERVRRTPPGPETVAPGMLPPANPRDNDLVRGQLVGSDAWALAGYRAAARLLHAASRDADAGRVETSRLAYREAFALAITRSGSPDVPPSFSGEGRDWGNLAVASPCAALPDASPRLAALARRYWAEAGGPGLGFWGSPDSLHGYVAADLGVWALRTGRRAEADGVLDALLDWRNASGAAGELFTRRGDCGVNLPPNATTAAALLQLVRNSVVDDDGDMLALTQGARERWWRGARIERAPTRWGMVSLAFERAGDEAHWRWTRVPVWTELVLPAGTRAREVKPPLLRGRRPDIVLAPPGTGDARVQLSAGAL